MKFVKLIIIVLYGCLLPCEGQVSGGFWWLNSNSEASSTTTTTLKPIAVAKAIDEVICCECVAYYLCPNGTISTDGANVIDIRTRPVTPAPPPLINVEVCDGLDICCEPPGVDPSCKERSEDLYGPILPPDTFCECIVYDKCDSGLVVSDGKGATSMTLNTGRIVSHSQCQHSLEVCCYLPPPLQEPKPEEPQCDCVEFYLCDNDGYIITDGDSILDLRIKPDSTDAKIPEPCPTNDTLLCCYHRPDTVVAEPPPKPVTSNTVSSSSPPVTNPSCTCVEFYLCDNDGFVVEDGAGILDLRIRPDSSSSLAPTIPCPEDETLVCCSLRNETDITERVKPTLAPTTTIAPYKYDGICGVRNSVGVGVRILGFIDSQTQFGEFPWVVTLLRMHSIAGEQYPLFIGGASLIHRRVVMTAAHKVSKHTADELLVRLGEWDVSSEKETHAHQDVNVTKIIIHPRFNRRSLAYDVALLILEDDAKFDYHIQPICPAKSIEEVDQKDCVTNGWGVDEHLTGDYQQVLKRVELPMVPNPECQNMLRRTKLSKRFRLNPTFLCAGGEEGIDTCKGDGGGPLACRVKNDPSKYLLVGMTAWGIGCGDKDVPGVYVNVPIHQKWIEETMKQFV